MTLRGVPAGPGALRALCQLCALLLLFAEEGPASACRAPRGRDRQPCLPNCPLEDIQGLCLTQLMLGLGKEVHTFRSLLHVSVGSFIHLFI